MGTLIIANWWSDGSSGGSQASNTLMALELCHMAPGSSIHVLLYTKVTAAPSPVEALEE